MIGYLVTTRAQSYPTPASSEGYNCAAISNVELRTACLQGQLNDAARQQEELQRQSDLADAAVIQAQAAAAITQNEADRTHWEKEAALGQAEYWTAQDELLAIQEQLAEADVALKQAQTEQIQLDNETQRQALDQAQWDRDWQRARDAGLIAALLVVGCFSAWVLREPVKRLLVSRKPQVIRETPNVTVIFMWPDKVVALGAGFMYDGQTIIPMQLPPKTVLPAPEATSFTSEVPNETVQVWHGLAEKVIDLGLALGKFSRQTITDYRDSQGRKVTRTTYDRMLEWFRDCRIVEETGEGTVLVSTDKQALLRDLGSPYPAQAPVQKPHQIPAFERDTLPTQPGMSRVIPGYPTQPGTSQAFAHALWYVPQPEEAPE